jgi:hypothetical protein
VTQQPQQPGRSGQQPGCGPQGRPAEDRQDQAAGQGRAARPARPAGSRPQDTTSDSRQQDRAAASRQPDKANGQRQQFDPIGDVQRWLIRSSARNMRREITGEVRRRIGGDRAGQDDVWSVAVTEPPHDAAEAPECAWCPVCRAARLIRERPGFGAQLSGAGEAVAAAVQEALGAFDGVLARSGPGTQPGRAGSRDSRAGTRDSRAGSSDRRAGEPDREPDDRS